MEGNSGGATAVFYGCKREVGADRAPADDWSSSQAGASWALAETLASSQARLSAIRG
jgi:hypothetical protein